jgi:hypothetical protein
MNPVVSSLAISHLIASMLDQLPGHPWHIRWFSREYVLVSPKETDEHEFLFLT